MASKITKGIIISGWVLYVAALGAVVALFLAIVRGAIAICHPWNNWKTRSISMLPR